MLTNNQPKPLCQHICHKLIMIDRLSVIYVSLGYRYRQRREDEVSIRRIKWMPAVFRPVNNPPMTLIFPMPSDVLFDIIYLPYRVFL